MTFPKSSLPEYKTVRTTDLVRLLELVPLSDIEVDGKVMRFQDPNAHDALASIRDAIHKLIDGSRYAPPEVAPINEAFGVIFHNLDANGDPVGAQPQDGWEKGYCAGLRFAYRTLKARGVALPVTQPQRSPE